MTTKTVTARKTTGRKIPGARPGDWIYRGKRASIPLPPLSEYAPNAEKAAIFEDLVCEVELIDKGEQNKHGRLMSKFMTATYRMVLSGLPDDYAEGFKNGVTANEVNDLLVAWQKQEGIAPGESVVS